MPLASPQDICSLPDEHPLKELFFAAFDQAMFRDLLARFVEQVRDLHGACAVHMGL